MTKYNQVIQQQITELEHQLGKPIKRLKLEYDPHSTKWSFRSKTYPDLKSLVLSNRSLFFSSNTKPPSIRTRDKEITDAEKRLQIRIYKYGVTRTKTGWKCRDMDQVSFIHAPSLLALLEAAPHCYISTYVPPPPSRQIKVKKLKDIVAEIKAQRAKTNNHEQTTNPCSPTSKIN
jgi:hypothetical protein